MGEPLQIIEIGDSENENGFILREDNLSSILDKIPQDTKVAIVAVVGAFRTGKSFLLNLFLRYLRNGKPEDPTQSWLFSEGDDLLEGNMNEGWNIVDGEDVKREMSFAWRGGQQRQTTGIWMWSEPFFRSTKNSNGEKLAILLMDTQGMFDNETTMTLTAQIFGLSTLVSSFQIYNVDKRIQEDNLQHLALFSEYGRIALLPQNEQVTLQEDLLKQTTAAKEIKLPKPTETSESTEETSTEPTNETTDNKPEETTSTEGAKETPKEIEEKDLKPFQRLQFLVRDWQNFDHDYEEGDNLEQYESLHQEMQTYLTEVLRTRKLDDLQSTRDQIVRCFDKLDCFQLPHPGFAVTKKNYNGSIKSIEPFFLSLINQYVRFVFDLELEAKRFSQHRINAYELKTFFEVYVKMFQAGEKNFPKAMTMLDATAEANNRNAYDLASQYYKNKMEELVGQDKPFVKEYELSLEEEKFVKECVHIFDEIATMGSVTIIDKTRSTLLEHLETEKQRYFTTNALRNPFKDLEFYLLPIAIALASWVLATVTDMACSTDFCERVEDTFVNIYLFVFFGIVVLMWKQIKSAVSYLKEILPMILNNSSQFKVKTH